MNVKINSVNREVTIYCDSSKRKYRNNDHYSIAGVILTDTQKALLNSKINQLKRTSFNWLTNPESVELKGEWITSKRSVFNRLRPEKLEVFLSDLSRVIFDVLKLKILPLYTPRLKDLPHTFPRLIVDQRPANTDLFPYLFFLAQYNNFLAEKGITGKVIFDQGDDNFKRLLKEQKEKEYYRVFHLLTSINMSDEEIRNCTKDSRHDNALQMADLFAYTICQFYALTHLERVVSNGEDKRTRIPKESFDELLKRIKPECKGKRYFSLPVERLGESYVRDPNNCWVLTARQKI